MRLPNIEHIILDLVVEDSYAPSEIVSRVQQVRPDLSASEVTDLVRRTVDEMLTAGLIAVTRLEQPGGAEYGLESDAARLAFADDLTWLELTQWLPHIRIIVTATGKEAYYESSP